MNEIEMKVRFREMKNFKAFSVQFVIGQGFLSLLPMILQKLKIRRKIITTKSDKLVIKYQ